MSISLGLSRISLLLQHLSSPHLKVPIIHVAGTNGKGSVCAYLDSILTQAGLSTGRFNSPHLISVNDSILVRNKPISLELYKKFQAHVEEINTRFSIEATPFELLTATAFQVFASSVSALDCAIIEVGMGGRDDATNVVPDPLLTILTAIELDHQAFLGNTLQEIATAKAGIIKLDTPCIIAPQKHQEVTHTVQAIAKDMDINLYPVTPAKRHAHKAVFSLPSSKEAQSTLTRHQSHISAKLPLSGAYQYDNSATAVLAAFLLHSLPCCRQRVPQLTLINTLSIIHGIEKTRWPGRLEWLDLCLHDGRRLQILADGAHNLSSATALRTYLDDFSEDPEQEYIYLVACSAPRDPKILLRPLLEGQTKQITVIATRFSTPVQGMPWVEAVAPEEIAKAAQELGVSEHQCLVATDAREAINLARALVDADELGQVIAAAGSLYFVADLQRLVQEGKENGLYNGLSGLRIATDLPLPNGNGHATNGKGSTTTNGRGA